MRNSYSLVWLLALVSVGRCSDITNAVFGDKLDGMPAAFGDFNSDELTDVFVVKNDGYVMEIMQASSNDEPLLFPMPGRKCRFTEKITSVVPGDFDGDVFMDVLVTTFNTETSLTTAHVIWGNDQRLNCSSELVIKMTGQPLAIDYNQDMIIDLFGMDVNQTRTFWIFAKDRQPMTVERMEKPANLNEWLPIRNPHANAFLDLNDDFFADLIVTTKDHFEVWHGTEQGFEFSHKIPVDPKFQLVGQSLFLDVELKGKLNLIVPVCTDQACTKTKIMIWTGLAEGWQDLKAETPGWNFAVDSSHLYTNAITLHGGDFNMDGYPDLLATLKSTETGEFRSFLLENSKADDTSKFNRTFQLAMNALSPFKNESVLAVFYDFYQDGVLDVILVRHDKNTKKYTTAALKNSRDYDENFVKVMVLSGRSYNECPLSPGRFGNKRKSSCGANLPGPSIAYKTITQDGSPRNAIAVQLPQSAHFSLNLPFTTFGLGRTPNFIDFVLIGVSLMKVKNCLIRILKAQLLENL